MRPRCSAGEIKNVFNVLKGFSQGRNEAPVFCRGNEVEERTAVSQFICRNEAPVFCRGNAAQARQILAVHAGRNEAPVFCRGNLEVVADNKIIIESQ